MQELSIKVNIADRHYPLKIRLADEENVRKAARRINERMRDYVENFAVADKQDALAMIALEFATEILELSENGKQEDKESEDLIIRIEKKLDDILAST